MFALSTVCLQGAIENVQVTGATATQAVVTYTAPDESPCRWEVSESDSLRPIVHDVNEGLFPGANQDDRPGSLLQGRQRIVVIGRRSAERAADGKRYSRALQANTVHYFRIVCGSDVATGSFTTENIPLGLTHNDPLPVDPEAPGQYAWPTMSWTDRGEKVVDPLTGLLLQRMTLPLDKFETGGGTFRLAHDPDGAWTNPAAAINDADGNAAATVRPGAQGHLFLDARQQFYQGGTHDSDGMSLAYFKVTLHAWCEGASCSQASEEDRGIQVCLTVDGVSCATESRQYTVLACNGNCGSDRYRFTLGDETPILAYWGPEPSFDITHAHYRSGRVNRDGVMVKWAGGNRFSLKWQAGSLIFINGASYQIDRVVNEETLTLAQAPQDIEGNAEYRASNFGILLRKKRPSEHVIAVQSARFEFGIGTGFIWDSSGDGETAVSCSEGTVAGPGQEQGYHCHVGYSLFWLGQESGTVIRLGVALFPDGNPGDADGWRGWYCGGVFWDGNDPNVFYCKMMDNATPPNDVIVRAQYFGDNRDVGSLSLYSALTKCNEGRPNQPCFEFTNLTPASKGKGLLAQLRAFHPDAGSFKSRGVDLVGRQGDRLILLARRDGAVNDLTGFLVVFDPATGSILGAIPSWRYWPLRWAVLHGPANIGDPNWALVPATMFRGPTSGLDSWAGNGPYRTKITSGAIGTAGSTCPARPADSPIPPEDWPEGAKCAMVTVEGEPCDPSPAAHRGGRIRIEAGSDIVTGTDTEWLPFHDGGQIQINNRTYAFSYVSRTSARLKPAAEENFQGEYVLFTETINHPTCANPLYAYLQDAEVRDVFCIQPDPGAGGCGVYWQTEFARLLEKRGNTWLLERKFGESGSMLPAPADSYLVAYPASCNYGAVYPCSTAVAYWNFTSDSTGHNTGGATVLKNTGDPPLGHGSAKPGMEVFSVAPTGCEKVDGQDFTCYGVRRGRIPELLSSAVEIVSNNPAFDGKVGLGSPNPVDSHPTVPPFSGVTDEGQRNWFLDARPLLVDSLLSGSRENPATPITGDLYRFRSDQLPRLRRKLLPTLAACGHNVLKDISGPSSFIDGSPVYAYTYCAVERDGECVPGSTGGEVYFNCPQISRPYCQYSGIGSPNSDMRDVCIGDNGAYTQALVQVGIDRRDQSGSGARVLTYALGRYRWNDIYWNAKVTPDAKWTLVRAPWFQGQRSEVLLFRLPPFPEPEGTSGNTFVPVSLWLKPPPDAGVDNAIVEFGYTPEFYCTSRAEACVKGNQAGNDYSFGDQGVEGVQCAERCIIKAPAIPNRVLYYRARYRDQSNADVAVTRTSAVALPAGGSRPGPRSPQPGPPGPNR